MRRTIPLLFALALLFGAAACGGGEEAQPLPETVEGTVPTDTAGEDETTTGEDDGEDDGEAGGGGEGDADAGKQIFASAGCGGCHVLADAGTSGTIGPNLDESQPSFELAVDRVTNGRGAMPPFKDQLSEEEIQNVAAYVAEAAGS